MAIVRAPYKIAPDGGEYSFTFTTGSTTVLAAAASIFALQWTSSALAMVVKRVGFTVSTITAYGTGQVTKLGLYQARSYTVAATGGTAWTVGTNDGKRDTKYPTSQVTDARISTTTALNNGTWTLDQYPVEVVSAPTTAIGTAYNYEFYFGSADDRQQIILRANEGLVVQNLILMGATGVIVTDITLEWAEIPLSDIR